MVELGYDTAYTSVDYASGEPAALGNYIALSYMELGVVDYSNEDIDYAYDEAFYYPLNDPLALELAGNPGLMDLNHWQPLAIDGHPARKFLSPQWGHVTPFSMREEDLTIRTKNGYEYWLYHDPGMPPLIDTVDGQGLDDFYKWNFALVAVWSGHLDPADPVMVDISPASVGNIPALPENEEEYRSFYDFFEGGVPDEGYDLNPATGLPYEAHLVPRGDFARVLAEFWADGPDSETPPGHWFTILNYVNDYPGFEKRFGGEGAVLDDLEWDVKAYLVMGGAMHDVAVAVWGVKSYYDYIRPISAIRGMASFGQSSDSTKMSYHPAGIPLVEGHIEIVEVGDALAGESDEHVGKIKIYAWRGPDHIGDPETSHAGVGWILAENWWPYQLPSFITPPFAGYVSGHSTFSRAAAEVMTLLTGDEYFPGGMGVFDAPKDAYLLFENGPSTHVELQWAKYRDASDQASLSRLWGGIHPPIDDVPGRKMGMMIGPQAFHHATTYFQGAVTGVDKPVSRLDELTVMQNYPNPVSEYTVFKFSVRERSRYAIQVYDMNGKLVHMIDVGDRHPGVYEISWGRAGDLSPGMYTYHLVSPDRMSRPNKLIKLAR